MNKRIVAGLAAVAALGLMAPTSDAATTASNPFNASCSVGANSTFTATVAGYYGWTWRTGTTVNGYGYRRLAAGESWTIATPGAATSSSKFGVVGAKSRTYSYVTCL